MADNKTNRFQSIDLVVSDCNIRPSIYEGISAIDYKTSYKNKDFAVKGIDLKFFLSALIKYDSVFPENKSGMYYMTNNQLDETIWEYLRINHKKEHKNWLSKLEQGYDDGRQMNAKVKPNNLLSKAISYEKLKNLDFYSFSDSLTGRVYSLRNKIIRELSSAGRITHQESVPKRGKNILAIHPHYIRNK
jgi:hypothetical protein